jgi:hypothetical protein
MLRPTGRFAINRSRPVRSALIALPDLHGRLEFTRRGGQAQYKITTYANTLCNTQAFADP